MESKLDYDTTGADTDILLIEPVWNRNHSDMAMDIEKGVSFNRTSMESKLPNSVVGFANGNNLLIEPVWNRNLLLT